jgi:hypothetical protein
MAAGVIIAAHTAMTLIQRWNEGWKSVDQNATPMRAKSLKH